MSITVRRSGPPPKIDISAAARAAAAAIPEIIKARIARGRDIFDRPFASYDAEYARIVGARVDLGSGEPAGLLSTLTVRVVTAGDRVVVVVAPDAKHAVVGAYLHNGTPKMKARPWLGLSPSDLVVLRKRVGA